MAGLLGAVVLLAAPFAGGTAAADQVGSTQSQIATIRSQIAADGGRVHQLTEAFDQANLTAAAASEQLAADRANLAATRRSLDASEQSLRESALRSYTGDTAQLTSDPVAALDPGVTSAYAAVAVGDLSDTVDQYHLRQRQLHAAEATVAAQADASRRAADAVGQARSAALAEASSAQSRLASLQQQLASLLAARAAASQAAATQGGPVGDGLVRVVTAMVQTAPAKATVASASPPPAPPTTVGPAPTVPPTTAPPVTTTVPPAPAPTAPTGGVWLQLRQCESSDNYEANTGNGFYGAYQFTQQTWTGLGYPGRPDLEPPAMQDQAAIKLQAQSGWGQWPACSAALGLT